MKARLAITMAIAWCLLCGCTTVDRNAAASLGTAGQNATQALSAQASAAGATLGNLHQWWGVHDKLICADAGLKAKTQKQRQALKAACLAQPPDAATDASVKQLADAIGKRKRALDTLNQAYAAFVDLARYNAGQEATAALKTSFGNVNSFLAAASALPGAAPIAPISTTIENIAAGGVSLLADNEQNVQILAANNDLKAANDALSKGLGAETVAMENLLVTLQDEREQLYKSAYDAGLISPTDVLTPVFAQAYPGIQLHAPDSADQDVVKAAANSVLAEEALTAHAAVSQSYGNAVKALQALAAQHQKLADNKTPTLGMIETDIADLQSNVARMSDTAKTPASK